MRADTRKRPPSSSSSEEDDERKFSVKPSLPDSDEPLRSKKKKKDVPVQANFKLKRQREEPFEASSSFPKKKRTKKSLDRSGIDLEELLAQTYPKEISAPVEYAKQIPAEGSVRRSNRKKKRLAKEVSDSAKKWSGDEEISLAMTLLECSSPEGEINIAAFYQRAKESLHDEVSRSQLYDKMRGMRRRFRAIQSKLKEYNVPEDEFPYKTRHEAALFVIWKQIWGDNGDNHEFHAENPKENGVQDLRLIKFENPRKNGVETSRKNGVETSRGIENENPRGNGAENSRENRDENPMEIEGENPRQYDTETPREKGSESPMVNDDERENSVETEGENPRGIEGEDCRDIGSESPRKNEVTNPRESGVDEDQHEHGQHEEKEEGEQSLQNSLSHETPNAKENGACKLLQSKSGGFEDNIKILLEKTESRLQASLESSINRVAVASAAGANVQPLGGFGLEVGMGIFLSRKMKELMDGVNSVKVFPSLDAVEAQELQQGWHTLKIQELRMFCDSLELLQKQCRLVLKNAECSSSNDNHGS